MTNTVLAAIAVASAYFLLFALSCFFLKKAAASLKERGAYSFKLVICVFWIGVGSCLLASSVIGVMDYEEQLLKTVELLDNVDKTYNQ